MNSEDNFKGIALRLSDQVETLTQIVSKLVAVQLQLKQDNLELKRLIQEQRIVPLNQSASAPTSAALVPTNSLTFDLFQPSPIKLFSSSSPDFGLGSSDDLVMSYFSSASVSSSPSGQDFDPRSVFRSDTSPMMGYQEFIPNLPMIISPLVTSPPLQPQQPPPPQPHQQQHAASQALAVKRRFSRKTSGPLKILIVEDDPLCQQLISHIIKSLHIGQCEVVADGVEAVINMSTNSFDLILMDMQLPHLDGLQATQNIRKFNRRTPIVSMTARLGEEDIRKYFEGGIDEVLPKPFDKQSVKKIIQQFYKLSMDEDS